MIRAIDAVLNRVTMYRLVVYVLMAYVVFGLAASLAGQILATPAQYFVSLVIVVAAAYVTDKLLARVFNAPANTESWLITSLILFLIMHPSTNVFEGVVLAAAAVLAMASKYFLTYRGSHIFNPAAVGAAVISLTGIGSVTWWIGSAAFWPLTLILGLAVARKTRRLGLVATFAAVSVVILGVQIVADGQPFWANLQVGLLSSPLIFLGSIMLTEPATMPPRHRQRLMFATLVAVLYVTAWRFGPVAIYPEIALLIGNVYAVAVARRPRLRLRLDAVNRMSGELYDFLFTPDRPFAYRAGQYMELTLPGVARNPRGNRRSFTLASAPAEAGVRLGVRIPARPSAYKAVLRSLAPGDVVDASQLSGDFTLDGYDHQPVALVASGIGITPFRSMVAGIVATGAMVDIVLIHAVSDAQELAYRDLFTRAARNGLRYVPLVSNPATVPAGAGLQTGRLDASAIAAIMPDYACRRFYISGSNGFVEHAQKALRALKVPRGRVKTDHFSGY